MNNIAVVPWNPLSSYSQIAKKHTKNLYLLGFYMHVWSLLNWFILDVHGIAIQELTLYQGSKGSGVHGCV
jgi:hypothetical protein